MWLTPWWIFRTNTEKTFFSYFHLFLKQQAFVSIYAMAQAICHGAMHVTPVKRHSIARLLNSCGVIIITRRMYEHELLLAHVYTISEGQNIMPVHHTHLLSSGEGLGNHPGHNLGHHLLHRDHACPGNHDRVLLRHHALDRNLDLASLQRAHAPSAPCSVLHTCAVCMSSPYRAKIIQEGNKQ
jgi:hypothetical protein